MHPHFVFMVRNSAPTFSEGEGAKTDLPIIDASMHLNLCLDYGNLVGEQTAGIRVPPSLPPSPHPSYRLSAIMYLCTVGAGKVRDQEY